MHQAVEIAHARAVTDGIVRVRPALRPRPRERIDGNVVQIVRVRRVGRQAVVSHHHGEEIPRVGRQGVIGRRVAVGKGRPAVRHREIEVARGLVQIGRLERQRQGGTRHRIRKRKQCRLVELIAHRVNPCSHTETSVQHIRKGRRHGQRGLDAHILLLGGDQVQRVIVHRAVQRRPVRRRNVARVIGNARAVHEDRIGNVQTISCDPQSCTGGFGIVHQLSSICSGLVK